VDGALGPHAYARARPAAMIADAQAKRLAVELRQSRVVEAEPYAATTPGTWTRLS
jgi:hypothetical protein